MTEISFTLLQQGFYIKLNWLGQLVGWIVEGVGTVGVGIIVFALILKAITTPFDIYQRVKMRKQNLIMEKMKPELEKLQKQYANDKQMYSTKMLELQKKNGYGMLGACLPMILSFVILIVAITAFQSYAQYANLNMYERMASSYNSAIVVYAAEGKDYHFAIEGAEDDELTISPEKFVAGEDGTLSFKEGDLVYTYIKGDTGIDRMEVRSDSAEKYLFYRYDLSPLNFERAYFIDAEKMKNTPAVWAEVEQIMQGEQNDGEESEEGEETAEPLSEEEACRQFFRQKGAAEAAKTFRDKENMPSFLWVKNVWYPDVSYNHPIQKYSGGMGSFTSTFSRGIRSENWEGERSIGDVIHDYEYEWLTEDLAAEKSQPNGLFILIVISIGLMFLSQFIMMKSSKATNQYQTVDGQGAMTQKIMMIMMPLMFAVFGFMWSAAFTIYNIISSALAIVGTLITNLVIDRIFSKKEEEELKERYSRTAPWKKEDKKDKKRK